MTTRAARIHPDTGRRFASRVSLPVPQESPGQAGDHVGLLVESEVAGVEDVLLGVWPVPAGGC